MPVVELDPNTKLDPPSGAPSTQAAPASPQHGPTLSDLITGGGGASATGSKIRELPADTQLDPPGGPSTTLGGLFGSAARGLAPYAAGAGIGAAIGAAGGPIGAAGGAGIMLGAETVASLYNDIAPHLGLPRTATPQDMTDAVMDWIGEKRPSTGVERTTEAVASSLGGTSAGIRAAEEAVPLLTGTSQRVAQKMAENPTMKLPGTKTIQKMAQPGGALDTSAGRAIAANIPKVGAQQVGSAISTTAAQTAANMGASPLASQLIGMGTGFATPVPGRVGRGMLAGQPKPSAVAAHEAGFTIPPSLAANKPGFVSGVAGGWAGKQATRFDAYLRNAENSRDLVREELGMQATDPQIDENWLDAYRKQQSRAYQNVSRAVPEIEASEVVGLDKMGRPILKYNDRQWKRDVEDIGDVNEETRKYWGDVTDSTEIEQLKASLRQKTKFTPESALGFISYLRGQARNNMLAWDDAEKRSLGIAQKQAADAVEDLMDRQITQQTKDPRIMAGYRQARTNIAKSWAVQNALLPDGLISAQRLARYGSANRAGQRKSMLTGNLAKIAKAGEEYTEATRDPKEHELYTQWDMMMMLGETMTGLTGLAAGHPKALLAPGVTLLRPAVRKGILSPSYQRYVMGKNRFGRWATGLPETKYDPLGYGIFPYVTPFSGFEQPPAKKPAMNYSWMGPPSR